jgi:transcriptional regulator with XRE-family HTH domain
VQEVKDFEFGTKIKCYLKDHGISQTWLANETGLGIKKVNDIVNGNVRLVANDLALICKALNISADYFLN